MRATEDWWFPDGETHMPEWMAKNRLILNDRLSYQGKKQLAAMALCTSFRTAIDVGAHVGTWAYNLAPKFKTVRCFEPVKAHRDCFVLNVAAENVVLYPMALGSEYGSVSIKTAPTSSGDSWIDGPGIVQMMPLDYFHFEDVDFIKIDTEGYEELILRGAEKTIRQCQPVICVEQKRTMATRFGLKPLGAVHFLETLGYVLVKEIGGDYLMAPAAKVAA